MAPVAKLLRVRAPLGGPSLSRAEAALRKVAQDWALACNTKQLDDLVELYIPDALVQRPNVPAVRGTAAIREFFFGILEAGMSEVELDPLRTELFGDFGYEAGRCKSLVPVAMGKRREERESISFCLADRRMASGESLPIAGPATLAWERVARSRLSLERLWGLRFRFLRANSRGAAENEGHVET